MMRCPASSWFKYPSGIFKRPPHRNSMIRCTSIRQHIGAIGMFTSKILRAGLPFTVCIYQKTTKVRNLRINLFCFFSTIVLRLYPVDLKLAAPLILGEEKFTDR